jgi:hypothetical protein
MFESRKGLWILSCEEAIQLGNLMYRLQCLDYFPYATFIIACELLVIKILFYPMRSFSFSYSLVYVVNLIYSNLSFGNIPLSVK